MGCCAKDLAKLAKEAAVDEVLPAGRGCSTTGGGMRESSISTGRACSGLIGDDVCVFTEASMVACEREEVAAVMEQTGRADADSKAAADEGERAATCDCAGSVGRCVGAWESASNASADAVMCVCGVGAMVPVCLSVWRQSADRVRTQCAMREGATKAEVGKQTTLNTNLLPTGRVR